MPAPGMLSMLFTEMESRLIVSASEKTEPSARLRISFTDCRVAIEMLSPPPVSVEKSDMMERSEMGRWGAGIGS